jgi:putative ABC transport system permease protein
VSVDWLLAPVRWLRDGTAIHRTLSLGYIRQRWMRTFLIVASIALGVATLVATRALNANLNKAGRDAANPLSGTADIVVTNGQTGVPRGVLKQIDDAQYAEIRDVRPMVFARVVIPELGNRSVLLIATRLPSGTDLTGGGGKEQDLVTVDIAASKADLLALLVQRRAPVLVGPDLARDLEGQPGGLSRFRVRLAGHEQPVACVGTARPTPKAGQVEKYVLYMQDSPASDLVYPDRRDFVSQINVSLHRAEDAPAIVQRLQQLVGPAYHVQTVEKSFEAVQDITAGLELGFAIGGAGALVVGLFLVYNALSVSVAERRHDIGILRSVGATRGQIAGLFVGEAAVLGLIGSLLGLPLGYGLAWAARGPMSRLLSDVLAPMEPLPLEVAPLTLVIAVASGVATTILAALLPAVQASLEEPADAVRRVPVALHALYRLAQAAGAALLIAVGVGCVLGRAHLPLRYGVFFGIIFVLIGVFVATPLLAALLSVALRPLFRRVFGLEGRLAADNLARSPGRTGLVVAAVAATGALMVQTAGFIRSSEDTVLRWLDESIAADLFVTAGGSMTDKASESVPLDEALADDLRAVPGVDAVLPVRVHFLEFRGRIVWLIALDADAFAAAEGRHALARNLAGHPELRRPGTALVSDNFASLYGVKVGQHIELDGRAGPLDVEVVGTAVDYTWNRGTIIVNRAWFRENYGDRQVNIFDVYLKKGADPDEVDETIRQRWGGPEGVFVTRRAELRDAVSVGLRKVYGIAYAQEMVVGLVALLGVISALFISVLQRRRELGLLRAVGASQAQVLRSVLAEAFQMGVIGGLLGFGVGLLLEWYVLDIVLLDEAGFVFPLVVPWAAAGVVFAGSVLTASVVGLWPAWHATRIRIAEAIAYE